MGRVAELLSWAQNTNGSEKSPLAKGDPGGLATCEAEHFDSSGVDAQPLPGDFFASHDGPGTGDDVVSGYHDPKTTRKAGAGEHRIYARSAPGVVSAEIWCKANGTVEISSLFAGGKVVINGVEIDQDGNVKVPGDVSSAGEVTAKDATPATAVGLSTHLHNSAMGPTSPPTGGT
jgi:hypothetical protein